MSEGTSGAPVHYTQFHPRWYRRPVSTWWWLGSWRYFKFILRELTSVFVAIAVVQTLVGVRALSRGPEAYAAFQAWLARPHVIALSIAGFLMLLVHAVTWFNLAPRAMVVHLRGKRVPDAMIALGNYGLWLVASVVVAIIALKVGK